MSSIRIDFHCFARGARSLLTIVALVITSFLWTTPSLAEEQKSADEIAKELANPNASLAKLEFENQFTWYKGDLPDADDQSNYTLLFQPVFPFTLADCRT